MGHAIGFLYIIRLVIKVLTIFILFKKNIIPKKNFNRSLGEWKGGQDMISTIAPIFVASA